MKFYQVKEGVIMPKKFNVIIDQLLEILKSKKEIVKFLDHTLVKKSRVDIVANPNPANFSTDQAKNRSMQTSAGQKTVTHTSPEEEEEEKNKYKKLFRKPKGFRSGSSKKHNRGIK